MKSRLKSAIITGSIFILTVLCEPALARGITVDSLHSYKKDNRYLLNARISYDFSNEVLRALEHGVALHFNVVIETLMKRQLLWDKTINLDTLAYRLEYHPLSQRYLLTEYNRFRRDDFRTLEAALNNMGRISEYPYADADLFDPDRQYAIRIRVVLDSTYLPAPLRPLSYISTDWQLSSRWKSVALTP